MFPSKPHEKFSECGIQKFSGRQYRTSRCLDNGFMEECIAGGKEHKRQTKKCTPSCKQSFINSRPPRYLYDNTSFGNKKVLTTKEKSGQKDQSSNSEDYELVTGGEVEEVKRRSKKIVSENHDKKRKDGFQHHNQALVSEGKEEFMSIKSNYVIPNNNLSPPHIKSTDSISSGLYNSSMSSIINKMEGKYM